MKQKILGFDCSSTTLAYAVLEINDNSIQFISANYIKPIKKGTIIERLAHTRDQIQTIIKNIQPTHIAIEDIISFMPKRSSAKTIITLAVFNRMIGLLAFDYLQISPTLLNVMTIRHGLKLKKKLPKKEDMPEIVAKHLKIKFKYILNKKNKPKEENYDLGDAMAVALYYALSLTNQLKSKKGK